MPMATNLDTSMRPPAHQPEPLHQVVPAQPEYTVNDLINAPKYTWNMKIVKVHTGGGANYDPKEAVEDLHAKLHDQVETTTGLEIPKEQFYVEYNKPGEMAPSDDHGFFTLMAPKPLKPIVMDLTGERGGLLYTGDERGTRYKLDYFDYVAPDLTDKPARREKNELYFFRLCPLNKKNGLPQRAIRDALALHIAMFGMTIQKHKDAFKHSLDTNRLWDGDWHVEYDIDWSRVPRDEKGDVNLTGLKDLTLDVDKNEKAFLKFKEDRMRNVWYACHQCFKAIPKCQCGLVVTNKPTGKKPQTAAQKDAQAQQRMKKRAAKDMSF